MYLRTRQSNTLSPPSSPPAPPMSLAGPVQARKPFTLWDREAPNPGPGNDAFSTYHMVPYGTGETNQERMIVQT